MIEEWRPLEGFSKYLFSNMGSIKRVSDGKIEPTTLSGKPQYYYVHLVPDGGKRSLYRLHRLIAKAWLGEPEDKSLNIVDHINRNRLDNRVENLRWVCRSGNQRNTDMAFFGIYKGFWVHVKTFYKDNPVAYGYASQNKHITIDLEELEERRLSSNHRKVVTWEGEERLLIELCDEYGVDYTTVFQRLNYWKDSSVYACMFYESPVQINYNLIGAGGVFYPFSSQQEIADYLGVHIDRVKEYLPLCENSLVELRHLVSDWKPQDRRTLYTIDGVSKYREDWIKEYETSELRVTTNMTKLKIPFEQAVKVPVARVKKVSVNGQIIPVKEMWEMFNLHPKSANGKKSTWKTTFKETLKRLGIDTEDLEITPL